MFNHEPEEYKCPFCLLIQGREDKNNSQNDELYPTLAHPEFLNVEKRAKYAQSLREYLQSTK
jgi:hypothetical protein